nr:adipolin isoform X1 [Equus asinus]
MGSSCGARCWVGPLQVSRPIAAMGWPRGTRRARPTATVGRPRSTCKAGPTATTGWPRGTRAVGPRAAWVRVGGLVCAKASGGVQSGQEAGIPSPVGALGALPTPWGLKPVPGGPGMQTHGSSNCPAHQGLLGVGGCWLQPPPPDWVCKMRVEALEPGVHLLSLQPTAQGAFLRGSGLSLASGRFTAPVSAIFQFSASLHVDHRELQGRGQLRARDTVRALICIESLCHRHTSLEAISGLESNGRVFTVHVQGLLELQVRQEGWQGRRGPGPPSLHLDAAQPVKWTDVSYVATQDPWALHGLGQVPPDGAGAPSLHELPLGRPVGGDIHCECLQAGQYTSVFVDNGSGAALTVQSSSSFSGLLLGM